VTDGESIFHQGNSGAKFAPRPGIILFVNGLPLALAELKKPNRSAEIWTTFDQIQTNKAQIKDVFQHNELLVIADGIEAHLSSLSAVRELPDETLKIIAHELTENLRQNINVDRSARECVRAKLRLIVKRILRKYKYPPDLQEAAVELVLKLAEVLGDECVNQPLID